MSIPLVARRWGTGAQPSKYHLLLAHWSRRAGLPLVSARCVVDDFGDLAEVVMKIAAPSKPALRLVPKPQGTIDADMVAFTVMEHIDTEHPTIWETLPRTARVGLRNAIVRAVMAEDAKR